MAKGQHCIINRIRGLLLTTLFLMAASISAYASELLKYMCWMLARGRLFLGSRAANHYMLIDGGGRASSSFVVSYLKQNGIEGLDLIAVSHYDEDHMSGTVGVLSAFPCGILLLPPYAGATELVLQIISGCCGI